MAASHNGMFSSLSGMFNSVSRMIWGPTETKSLRSTEFDAEWKEGRTLRDNVANLLKTYIPHPLNLLSRKTNSKEAEKLSKLIQGHTDFVTDAIEIYRILLEAQIHPISKPDGEFARRLDYAIGRIKADYPHEIDKPFMQSQARF